MNLPDKKQHSMFVIICLCAAGVYAGQNWPGFRGAGAGGVAEGYTTVVKWDIEKSENILWNTPIPGLAHSSPAVWADKIFITTAIKKDGKSNLKVGLYGNIESKSEDQAFTWRLYCIDKKTGKILWNKDAHTGKPKIKRHPKSSHANATPCTNGKYVIAFFGSEGLHCYDMDGNLIWKKNLGVLDWGYFRIPSAQWGGGSSPVIHEQKVIVQCDVQKDSFIAAFNLKDGSEVWKTSRQEVPTWSTPTVYADGRHSQIIVNGFKHIGAYDLAAGKQIWKMKGGGDIPVPTPVVSDGLIYITNAHGGMAPIYAVRTGATGDISLGKDQTSNEHIAWSIKKGGNYMTTPIVYKGLLYCCANNGKLSCFEAKTGLLVYQQRLQLPGSKLSSAFSASPVAAADRIYFTGEKGNIYVVKAGTQFELLAVNRMGETCMATPAISQGVLFFRTRSHLVAVGKEAN